MNYVFSEERNVYLFCTMYGYLAQSNWVRPLLVWLVQPHHNADWSYISKHPFNSFKERNHKCHQPIMHKEKNIKSKQVVFTTA